MLNRFPKPTPTLTELLRDPLLKNLSTEQLANFAQVHKRSVQRWKKSDAPASVRLALWAFSCQGLDLRHSETQRLQQIIKIL